MLLAGFPVNRSMYGAVECLKPSSPPSPSAASLSSSPASLCSEGNRSLSPPPSAVAAKGVMLSHLTVETEDDSSLLELAANNDLEGFKGLIERDPSAIDRIGLWYGRRKGSNQMVLEQRTPLMVAATYGSVDVLKLILSLSAADINRCCGSDKTTALHCAASGGSVDAADAVKVLLFAGADPNSVDVNGHRPCDVIVVPPKHADARAVLEELLGIAAAAISVVNGDQPRNLRISISPSSSNSPPLSSSLDEDGSPSSDSTSSPMTGKFHDLPPSALSEKKEYPIDPLLPDIKNSIYATDEFRMFSFKVRPCSRAYSHDWTECPFVHPGENARRRDPRKYHYSCVPCPDFRKGACRRGDLCEYAHGVFECWLHPAQYRTRLCKDGTGCSRRVCFFAHTSEELRPLYVSTGSAVPSPRSSASAASAMEIAAAMSMLPGSPSSVSMMSLAPYTPPISPSAANGISHSSLAWPQPNVPTLSLPGSSLHSSRLRTSLSARDIPVDDFLVSPEFDSQQLLNDFSNFSSIQSRLGPLMGNLPGRSKMLTPSNLDDLFSAEISSSPRYDSDQGAVFSPSHKAAVLNQFQQQQQGLLSPINTNVFSPRNVDPALSGNHNSFLQASLGISPPGRMSPRCVEPISPLSGRMAAFAQREKQQQLRTLSSRELGSGLSPILGSPVNSSMAKWGSPAGKLDWGVNGDELAGDGRFKRSSSFELGSGEEPDLSWVQSLVKESPSEVKDKLPVTTAHGAPAAVPSGHGGGSKLDCPVDDVDHTVLGAWLEQVQLDQMGTLEKVKTFARAVGGS
uniref:Zinc finger CCCH domain-containing protein 24 n=1 Tax=Anthurium amnicola TaxID=1678845 RepID=A0A1D1Z2G1_9ARAE